MHHLTFLFLLVFFAGALLTMYIDNKKEHTRIIENKNKLSILAIVSFIISVASLFTSILINL